MWFAWKFAVHSAKPVDRDQDSHYVGVIIALLTAIILLLVAAIMFIVSRNKRSPRSDVLNSLQHNFNQDTLGLGIDKRHHMKVIFQFYNYSIRFCHESFNWRFLKFKSHVKMKIKCTRFHHSLEIRLSF